MMAITPLTPHVLAIDDDAAMRQLIADYLRENDLRVTTVATGADMENILAEHAIDVVVLDLRLGAEDGMQLARKLRESSDIPIIILSGRQDEADRVMGLELGADDYITKPFSPRELLARVRAVLRRARMLPPNMQVNETVTVLQFGDWRLDTVARHLIDSSGTIVALSGGEYRLLRVFLDHPQRVLTREQLLNLTQGRRSDPFDRSIDLLVSRLRQRLQDEAREPRYIKTLRSEGYVFSASVTVQEASR